MIRTYGLKPRLRRASIRDGRALSRCLRKLLQVAPMIATGCQLVGPSSINYGRADYNSIIHETSQRQLLSNIVRSANNEYPTFMDVTEVDASVLFQGSVTGMLAGIGARKKGGSQVGTVGAGLEYQESPTIRYFPLLGAALVSQITTPITVDSLASLFNSDWPIASVLAFAVDRLTPGYEDYYSALNSMVALDGYGALVIAPARSSDLTPSLNNSQKEMLRSHAQTGAQTLNVPNPQSSPLDTIALYLRPLHPSLDPLRSIDANLPVAKRNIAHLWIRLLKIYQPDTSVLGKNLDDTDNAIDSANSATLDRTLTYLYSRPILIPASLKVALGESPHPPIIQTRSALGTLNTAAGTYIEFVSPEKFITIRNEPWNRSSSEKPPGSCFQVNFYTLLSTDQSSGDAANARAIPAYQQALKATDEFLNSGQYKCVNTTSPNLDVRQYWQAVRETALGTSRRFILVVQSESPPQEAYVSIRDRGSWFYIDKDDGISQRNFTLLNQLLTMQAVPPTSPPLTPTISVGGKGG